MRPRVVVVAHREAMVAEAIAAALERFPGVVPIAVAGSALEAERHADRADAVALDARLPGAELTAKRLRRKGVRVVIVGEQAGEEDDALRVSPRTPVATLANALIPELRILSRAERRLTDREREVLALVARGYAAKQVARQLGISPKTVERHKTRIYAKLGAPNQAAAVHLAFSSHAEGSRTWASTSI